MYQYLKDVIEEYEELKDDILNMEDEYEFWENERPDEFEDEEAIDSWQASEPELPEQDDIERLEYLKEVIEYIKGYSKSDDVELISDWDFTDRMMEFLEEYGEIDTNKWYIVINEDATVENMKQDYTSVDIDGETYWFRWCVYD